MKILALEFSSPQRSIAVVQAGALPPPGETPATVEVVETGQLPSRSIGMTAEVLRQAQLEREQIECLAIGLGPGSYTGIRAAIALAQGWQLAREVKLVGISSADIIAAQAQTDGIGGPVAVVIDAQRGEFYLANYVITPHRSHQIDPLRLASLGEVQACLHAGQTVVGPEVTKWFPEGRIIFPRASRLGTLALLQTDFVPGNRLEPIYLRQTTFVKAPPPRTLPA
jgi:tRNA threonylcarbamoyl adenosine modification protein YeaZ